MTSEVLSTTIIPLGDAALLVRLGERIDAITFHAIQTMAQQLDQQPPAGLLEYVPAFTSLAIYYDPLRASFGEMREAVQDLLDNLSTTPMIPGRSMEIPVCYGDEFGEDLAFVAKQHDLSTDEVVAIHTGGEYLVHMLGFTPGFPYLGGMSPRIATPRKASPRLRVAAGSVGIAGEQTGIYPLESPGGWQIIGRTPLKLFCPTENPPTLLQAGDCVRFKPITKDEFHALLERPS